MVVRAVSCQAVREPEGDEADHQQDEHHGDREEDIDGAHFLESGQRERVLAGSSARSGTSAEGVLVSSRYAPPAQSIGSKTIGTR